MQHVTRRCVISRLVIFNGNHRNRIRTRQLLLVRLVSIFAKHLNEWFLGQNRNYSSREAENIHGTRSHDVHTYKAGSLSPSLYIYNSMCMYIYFMSYPFYTENL